MWIRSKAEGNVWTRSKANDFHFNTDASLFNTDTMTRIYITQNSLGYSVDCDLIDGGTASITDYFTDRDSAEACVSLIFHCLTKGCAVCDL